MTDTIKRDEVISRTLFCLYFSSTENKIEPSRLNVLHTKYEI